MAEQNFDNAPNKFPPPYEVGHPFRHTNESKRDRTEARRTISTEDTPLLSRDPDSLSSAGSLTPGAEEIDDRGPPAWSGERDFEGRPWWNKPNVREATHLNVMTMFTYHTNRFFGCCHLSFSTQWPSAEALSLRPILYCP